MSSPDTQTTKRRATKSGVTRSKTSLLASVLEALQALSKDDSTPSVRAAATAIVELRQRYEHQGMPDWTGRSIEYRDVIERLYRQAEVPPDSESSVQAKLRYHIGNVLREVAPADQLEQLGLSTAGPKGRAAEHRASGNHRRRAPAEVTRTRVDSPLTVAALALDALKLLRAMDIAPDDREIVDGLVRKAFDECVEYLKG